MATCVFLSLGLFYILTAGYPKLMLGQDPHQGEPALQELQIENFGPALRMVAVSLAICLLVGLMLSMLLAKFPAFTLYLMTIGGLLTFLTLIVFMFICNYVALGVILCLLFLLFLIFVGCSNYKMKAGIEIFEITLKIIPKRPSLGCIPLMALLLALGFEVFWVASLFGIAVHHNPSSTSGEVAAMRPLNTFLTVLWVFYHLFYSYFLYNCAVFIMATALALSFYGLRGNAFCRGIGTIVAHHIGSFTLSYFLVAPVSVLRQTAECDQRGHMVGCGIYSHALSCCFKFIEGTFEVLNHNSIAMMSISGENYLNSARTALAVVSYNMPIFYMLDYLSTLITVAGSFFLSSLSALLGLFLLRNASQDAVSDPYIPIGVLAILSVSLTMSSILLCNTSETLTSMFLLYCLEARMEENKMETSTNPEIGEIFDEMAPFIDNEEVDTKRKRDKIKGLVVRAVTHHAKKKLLK